MNRSPRGEILRTGWARMSSSWYNRLHMKRRAAQTPDVTGDRKTFRPLRPLRCRRTLLAQPQSGKEAQEGSHQTTFFDFFSPAGPGRMREHLVLSSYCVAAAALTRRVTAFCINERKS